MARRKSVCTKWTLVILVVLVCPFVYTRPQETSVKTDLTTESSISVTSQKTVEVEAKYEASSSTPVATETPREVKTKVPIRESIKLVANQLLDKPNMTDTPVADSRIPPKIKTQVKNKIKTRNDHEDEKAHAGIAVPVTMEELETERTTLDNESTTTNEGISTWVLVSSPLNTSIVSTEPTKTDDTKKQKPTTPKNKNKKPPNKAGPKRPVIGSTNKSDLIAGGSAINENVYNKIKDTVLTNVQKNKTPSTTKITTVKTTTLAPTTETTTKKEEIKPPAKTTTKGTTKPKKKNKNKNKNKVSVKEDLDVSNSAMLPMEAKEQEIELEVSTPPITTKKPKRTSTRKKTKTKKRKTSTKTKPEEENVVADIKTNKTKSAKPGKKPAVPTTAVTTTLYNYFSREVMPSVGVGVLGLASLVGIASYFFYPFSTPVRRTFEVDKRDDLYKNNAEEYASEGNGQAEEEMLGTVLAGMPAHAKNKLNPYAGQTAYINRYPVKKEQQQDIRYRQVATKYDQPNYNVRYPQQKTGIAHAAVYSKPIKYSSHYETRHAYTTEGKFNFDKLPTSYSNYNYPTVEPIYPAPQTGPSSSDVTSYGNEASHDSVVYGVKPSSGADFKPVYPFEGHFYSETTNSPATYAPTSLYLGSDNEAQTEEKIETSSLSADDDYDESKFVVGNVPKELADSATPAVVPEHGPRHLNRKKRDASNRRSISTSLEEIIMNEKENNIFLSNEIDDSYMMPIKNLAPITEVMPIKEDLPTVEDKNQVFPVYTPSVDPMKNDETTTPKTEIIESVSTVPIDNKEENPSETDSENNLETTTKVFRVYEVFSSPDGTASPINKEATKESTTVRNMMTETTTELKSETTSTMPSTAASMTEPKDPLPSTLRPTPIYPDVITYPPPNQPGGLFSFLKRLVDFKVRLGLSILQNTSESLNKFLKSMENSTVTQTTRKNQKIKEN